MEKRCDKCGWERAARLMYDMLQTRPLLSVDRTRLKDLVSKYDWEQVVKAIGAAEGAAKSILGDRVPDYQVRRHIERDC